MSCTGLRMWLIQSQLLHFYQYNVGQFRNSSQWWLGRCRRVVSISSCTHARKRPAGKWTTQYEKVLHLSRNSSQGMSGTVQKYRRGPSPPSCLHIHRSPRSRIYSVAHGLIWTDMLLGWVCLCCMSVCMCVCVWNTCMMYVSIYLWCRTYSAW